MSISSRVTNRRSLVDIFLIVEPGVGQGEQAVEPGGGKITAVEGPRRRPRQHSALLH